MSKNRSISLFHLRVIATTLPKALFYCRLTLCGSLIKPADRSNSPMNGNARSLPVGKTRADPTPLSTLIRVKSSILRGQCGSDFPSPTSKTVGEALRRGAPRQPSLGHGTTAANN